MTTTKRDTPLDEAALAELKGHVRGQETLATMPPA
jgi:hypothetical protein